MLKMHKRTDNHACSDHGLIKWLGKDALGPMEIRDYRFYFSIFGEWLSGVREQVMEKRPKMH